MAKKKRQDQKVPPPPAYPMSVETFQVIGSYDLHRMTTSEPMCWNGEVKVERYRVTIEKIEEPVEVIHERLRKLWREATNPHHWGPIRAKAKEFGLVLDEKEMGSAGEPRARF